MKKHSTILLGLGITAVFLGLGLFRCDILDRLELKFYDFMMNLRVDPEGPGKVVLVEIDDDSINKLGHWPWPRSLIATGISKISSCGPRVIGLNLDLSKSDVSVSSGLRELITLKGFFAENLLEEAGDKGGVFLQRMVDAQARLDNDRRLAESIKESGKVVLRIFFNGSAVARPLPVFSMVSKGIGHITPVFDIDGKARRERLLYERGEFYIPSFTLRLAALYLNISPEKLSTDLGSVISMGSFEIPVASDSELLVNFKGPGGSFDSYSFFDVINDNVPLTVFDDKLVLLTPTAAGIMNTLSTPAESAMPQGDFSAHSIWTILNKKFVKQASWDIKAGLAMILVLGLAITFVFPRLKPIIAALAFVTFFIMIAGGAIYCFVSKGLWVRVTYPLMQLVCCYTGVLIFGRFVTGGRKEKSHGESEDTRTRKQIQADETMALGDSEAQPASSGTRIGETLGRYKVIRQLGKGSMGTVFLGQDPRIDRTTAIKVFRFTDDFEPEEAKKVGEKFFLEAKSAGTLSHPNIVTIYDAGEDQGMVYIAMEYLEGDVLQKYTKKGSLLPIRKVIDYVADIADALSYAHQKGIVHRDIKPANIMLLNSGKIKITDFGIARISASSHTRTGVVKGTPHYMSPEQISGEKVDGRSDIFSLGIMLFELLTGELPFSGDNLAKLMTQIMDEPHPDPKKINPKIAKPFVNIINKTLEKDREKRYQKASGLVAHLRKLGEKIDALAAKKKEKGPEQ